MVFLPLRERPPRRAVSPPFFEGPQSSGVPVSFAYGGERTTGKLPGSLGAIIPAEDLGNDGESNLHSRVRGVRVLRLAPRARLRG